MSTKRHPSETDSEPRKRSGTFSVPEREEVRIEVVTSLEDLLPCFRLRHDVYCVHMHAYPTNRFEAECDCWDLVSSHFRATRGGKTIGYARFVRACKGRFPMEDRGFVLPEDLPRETTLEYSRFCVSPTERVPGLAAKIVKAADLWSRENGFTHWVFTATAAVETLRDREGWRFDVLGPPRERYGYLHTPYLIPLHDNRFGW